MIRKRNKSVVPLCEREFIPRLSAVEELSLRSQASDVSTIEFIFCTHSKAGIASLKQSSPLLQYASLNLKKNKLTSTFNFRSLSDGVIDL
jgi:hypothetical protein